MPHLICSWQFKPHQLSSKDDEEKRNKYKLSLSCGKTQMKKKKNESGQGIMALKKNSTAETKISQQQMQEEDDDKIYTHPVRRNWCIATVICCTLAIFIVALIILILVLTVFKPCHPTITLLSIKIQGYTPSISIPAEGHVHINITIDLDLLVYNPNGAQFNHDPGYTQLRYRGSTIGDAQVAAGRILAKGSEHVSCRVLVVGMGFVGMVDELLADVGNSVIGFDTSSRIEGEIVLLGVITRPTVAASNCHFLVQLPEFNVQRQQCEKV